MRFVLLTISALIFLQYASAQDVEIPEVQQICTDSAADTCATEATIWLETCLAGLSSERDILHASERCGLRVVMPVCEGHSRPGMINCAAYTRDAWEVVMNRIYGDLLAQFGGGAHSEALARSQEIWLAYREAECGWQGMVAHGGREETIHVVGCQAQMTVNRSASLFMEHYWYTNR